MIPIMDVSRWQGDIDWDKVKAEEITEPCFVKADI